MKFVREKGADICHLNDQPAIYRVDSYCRCRRDLSDVQVSDDWPPGTSVCRDCFRALENSLADEEEEVAGLREEIRKIYQNMRRISGVLAKIEGTERAISEAEALNEKWPNLWNRVFINGEPSGLVQEARLLYGKTGFIELEVDRCEFQGEGADLQVTCRSVLVVQSLLLVSTRDLGQPFINALEELCSKFSVMWKEAVPGEDG